MREIRLDIDALLNASLEDMELAVEWAETAERHDLEALKPLTTELRKRGFLLETDFIVQ